MQLVYSLKDPKTGIERQILYLEEMKAFVFCLNNGRPLATYDSQELEALVELFSQTKSGTELLPEEDLKKLREHLLLFLRGANPLPLPCKRTLEQIQNTAS